MNRIHRVVFNRALGSAQVVSEVAGRGRGGVSSDRTGGDVRSGWRRSGVAAAVAGLAALQLLYSDDALAACTPAAPTDGANVTCSDVATVPAPNSFSSPANNLNLTVAAGAVMSTPAGGTALTLSGNGLTLDNQGTIDATAAGAAVLARGLSVGNLAAPGAGTVTINNAGTIRGTFDGTFSLTGAAAVIANTGTTTFSNSGSIGMGTVGGGSFDPANSIAVGIYGGGNVSFRNTGSITGRVAFAGSAGGNTFVNAGTINGSVALGSGAGNNTFTAVTGSSIGTPLLPFPSLTVGALNFAAGGTVNAGAGSADMLVLQNTVNPPGSGNGGTGAASSVQYLNFENLLVNSGTWTLTGPLVTGSTTLNGGTANFDNALAFGSGTLTGNGGALEASVNGLALAQNVNLTGGLIVQGGNNLTLGGTVSGGGGITKNGVGTLTLSGNNNFSGGFALNQGGLTLGSGTSLGSGLFLVGGPTALNTAFTGAVNNPMQLNGALTLNGAGTLTWGGNINGAGSLTLASGALSLASANNYTGGTVLQAGSLNIGTGSGIGTGALTINGAASLTGAAGATLGNTVVLNSTLNFGAGGGGGALTLNGNISGAGGISLAGAPGLTLNGPNTFSGGFNMGGGALTVGSNTALGLGSVTVSVAGSLSSNTAVRLANNFNLNAGVTVTGAGDLALDGAIGGLRGFVKNGTGKFTLSNANTFAGGVTLQSGALGVGTNSSLGLGTLTVSGPATLDASASVGLANNVVLNADLTVSGANDISMIRAISGPGGLRYNGSARLTLFTANTFAGGVELASGTLSPIDNLALGTGQLNVVGNARLAPLSGVVLGNGITLATGTTLSLGDINSVIQLNGTITGAGALAIADLGQITLSGPNNFGGGVTLQAGTLRAGSDTALGTGTLTVTGPATLGSNGNATLANDITLNAGLRTTGPLLTLNGTISGPAGLTAADFGILTLGGANTYAGPTTVAAGTLLANNASGSATGTGAVDVQAAGTLGGNGRIAGNVTLATGATLAPGASAGAMGTLAIGGNLSLANGSQLNLDVGTPGSSFSVPGLSDTLSIGGDLAIAGTATVNVTDAGGFGPGVYRLVEYGGTLAPGSNLVLGTVPGGGAPLSLLNLSADKRFTLVNSAGLTLNFWNANGLASPVQAGGGSGTWSVSSPVWTDSTGAVTVPMQPQPGFAIFSGAPGTVTVDNTGGPVEALGLQFASSGYTLAGDTLWLAGTGGTQAEIRVGDGGAGSAGYVATLNNAIDGNAGIVKTGAGTLVLAGTNTYSGGTTVQAGTLSVSADANLGSSIDALALDGGRLQVTGTGYAGTGRAVEIGAAGGGVEVVDAGHDFELAGAMSGSGTLVKSGDGTLTLSGTSTRTGGTTIDAGLLRTGAANLLSGTAPLVLADRAGAALNLDGFDQSVGSLAGGGSAGGNVLLGGAKLTTGSDNTDTRFGGAISGGGSLAKEGTGTLTLAGINTYTGTTDITAGTLRAGAANTLSAASATTVASGATLDLAGFNQRVAALTNDGTVSLLGSAPGTTLTVTGPYVGNNGVLRVGAMLGAAGASDRLVLDGPAASASGRTTVQVTNLGGLGALTAGNGIEVVSALNGATTTAQSTKDAFALAGGHIDAGAYEYRLHAADANGAGENWYLRSTTDAVAPGGPGTPGTPGAPGTPSGLPLYRTEVPLLSALSAQLRQADFAMLGNLHLRGGDDAPVASGDSATASGRRAWGRVISTDIDISQRGTVSPESRGRLNGFQAGTDLWADANWRAGLYVGQLEGNVDVRGFASGVQGLGVGANDLRSRYLGAYVNWRHTDGWYVDTVLQAGQHRYSARSYSSLGGSGKGDSLLASVEIGKSFAIGNGWRIEPQLQLIHQHLSLDDTSIPGAWVSQSPHSGLVARLGARIQGEISTGAGMLQPYGRINVIRRAGGTDVTQFLSLGGNTAIVSEAGGTSTEAAGGFTLALGERTAVYGELGKLWASGGGARVKSSINASVGMRVRW